MSYISRSEPNAVNRYANDQIVVIKLPKFNKAATAEIFYKIFSEMLKNAYDADQSQNSSALFHNKIELKREKYMQQGRFGRLQQGTDAQGNFAPTFLYNAVIKGNVAQDRPLTLINLLAPQQQPLVNVNAQVMSQAQVEAVHAEAAAIAKEMDSQLTIAIESPKAEEAASRNPANKQPTPVQAVKTPESNDATSSVAPKVQLHNEDQKNGTNAHSRIHASQEYHKELRKEKQAHEEYVNHLLAERKRDAKIAAANAEHLNQTARG